MKIHTKTLLAASALAASAVFAGTTSADTLASYDIESNTFVPDTAGAADLTASLLNATSADGTSTNFEWVGSRVPFWQQGNTGELNKGTDPGTDDIILTWTLTADAGKQIDIATTDALSYGVLAQSSNSSYITTTRVFVASDVAFTNILATSTTLSDFGNGGSNGQTLGSVTFNQAISSPNTLYFGLAAVDSITVGGADSRVDGITVTGTVNDVPEPGSLALLGLGGLLVASRRRRA